MHIRIRLRDRCNITDRWTDTRLAQAVEAVTAWENGIEPSDMAELLALYWRISFALRFRSMRADVYRELQPALLRVHDLMRRVLPPQCVPVSALAHVETRTFPDRLASVRSAWPVTRRIPLIVYARGGPLALLDGNHRARHGEIEGRGVRACSHSRATRRI